jgi:toxin CcdB
MARFDVHGVANAGQLLVICQSEYLDHLPTRFVVPLIPVDRTPPIAEQLNPILSFDSRSYVLAPNAAATLRVSQLGTQVGSLAHEQDTIMKALDLLISGF